MSQQVVYTNFSNGYIAEYTNTGNVCVSWVLIPGENLWSPGLRAFLYLFGMIYLFFGVAIGSDVFMTSIEVITSKKRTIAIWDKTLEKSVVKEVLVWNETVANLTLLALGSSAPEILLATIEAVTQIASGNFKTGQGLGFYTILGSASFNLLIITAICIMSVRVPETKKLRLQGVFLLTATWSLLAYIWLLACVQWITPGQIDIWEAVITLIFFPLLVLTAYAQDHNWWIKRFRLLKVSAETNKQDVPNGRINNASTISPRSPDLNRIRSNGKSKTNESIATKDREAIEMGPISLPAYKPFARARFRHAAIKAIAGGGAKALSTPPETPTQQPPPSPKLFEIVTKMASERNIYKGRQTASMNAASSVSFASPSYSVMENAGNLIVDVLLHRRRRLKSVAKISVTENGEFKEKEVPDAVTVEYETREATAVVNKDFKYTAGQLVFNDSTYVQSISVPIINDDQYNPDTDFYIILKNPRGDICLGDPSVCRVTIIDDDKPGDFVMETSQLYADMELGTVLVTVMRQNGSDGDVHVDYATVDATAKGGLDSELAKVDYAHRQGKLQFKHNEESKTISVPVNKDSKGSKNFVVVLRNPSQGSQLGDNSACVVNLNTSPSVLNGESYVLDDEENLTWMGQIRGAMAFGKEMNDKGEIVTPGVLEYVLHFFSFAWKIIFALIPPATMWGGYPAFVLSLTFIGAITAVLEQFGTLLGCAVDLKDAVTGLCIISIGTSVPDTFASRSAALHDNYADAAIGNITGSNSVNVFLGLGLPWLIRSIYSVVYEGQPYKISAESIDLSIYLFDGFGLACVILLLVRRKLVGGELGGSRKSQYLSSGFLVVLYLTYTVVLSVLAK